MANDHPIPNGLRALGAAWICVGALCIAAGIRIPLYVDSLGSGDGAGVAFLLGIGAALLFCPLGLVLALVGLRLPYSVLARKLALGSAWASIGLLALACLGASTVGGFAVLCLLFVLVDGPGIWQVWGVFAVLPLFAGTLLALKSAAIRGYFAELARDQG